MFRYFFGWSFGANGFIFTGQYLRSVSDNCYFVRLVPEKCKRADATISPKPLIYMVGGTGLEPETSTV
jgi:hypothetical protein